MCVYICGEELVRFPQYSTLSYVPEQQPNKGLLEFQALRVLRVEGLGMSRFQALGVDGFVSSSRVKGFYRLQGY